MKINSCLEIIGYVLMFLGLFLLFTWLLLPVFMGA